MRYLLIVYVALVLSGCVANSPTTEPWVGHNITEVETLFGSPTFHADAGDGQRLIGWEFINPRYGTKVCRRSFIVDNAGVITRWSYRGCSFYF